MFTKVKFEMAKIIEKNKMHLSHDFKLMIELQYHENISQQETTQDS